MTNLLQNSTFPHDLDPHFVQGTCSAGGGTVTVSLLSDGSSTAPTFGLTSGVGLQDNNSFKISYTGPAGTRLTGLTFNPTGTAATAGNTTGGNNGVDSTITYFSNLYPGVVWMPATKAFTTGTFSGGLVAGDVAAPTFSNLAPAPSNGTNQWWTMAMTFPTGNFTTGRSFTYTVGRGQQHSSTVGTFAAPQGGAPFAGPNSGATVSDPTGDLLGQFVAIPEDTVFPFPGPNAPTAGTGMAIRCTVSDGTPGQDGGPFQGDGVMTNAIGDGYSILDGYGFINAEEAATGSLVIPSAVTLSSVVSRKTHGGACNVRYTRSRALSAATVVPMVITRCGSLTPTRSRALVARLLPKAAPSLAAPRLQETWLP